MAKRTSFSGKVAVVTGAGGGLGRALALDLARRGARVAVSDIDGAAARETADLIRVAGGTAIDERVDVCDAKALRLYAGRVAEEWGVVNQVYNNAGVALTAGQAGRMPDSQVDPVLAVNLRGVMRVTRYFLPHLIRSGDGLLCNIASINGVLALGRAAPYSASKFGVIGYSDAVRIEMLMDERPVDVCLVLPGGIATGIASGLPPGFEEKSAEEQAAIMARRKAYQDRVYRMTPEVAAGMILNRVARGQARIVIGHNTRWIDLIARLFPAKYPFWVARWQRRLSRNA